MDYTHLHLALNHVPLLGSIFGAILMIFGLLSNSRQIRNIALVTFVVAAAFIIGVFLTGESAEETVEALPGISEGMVENHEESAKASLILTLILGGFALISLGVDAFREGIGKKFAVVTLLISFVAIGFVGRTGYLGGKIHHTEISSAGEGINSPQNLKLKEHKEDDDDD